MSNEAQKQIVLNEAPAVSESAAIIQVIERAASNPNVDIEKMERLLAMQERILDRQAEQQYAAAMVRAQQNMPVIVKNKHNQQTSSKYADLEAINRQIKPIYSAEGFSLSFDTANSELEKHIKIICEVLHAGGHSRKFSYDAPLDDAGIAGKVNKTPTHARGSSISYGRRYLVVQIFNLTISDEDDDGNGAGASPVIGPVQARRLEALLKRCSQKAQDKFAEMYGSPKEVLKSEYDDVAAKLENSANLNAAGGQS